MSYLNSVNSICHNAFRRLATHTFQEGVPVPDEGIIYAYSRDAKKAMAAMRPSGRYVLITRECDVNIDSSHAELIPACVQKWFATNVVTEHPKIEATPYGLMADGGAENIIKRVLQRPRKKANRVLVCHMLPSEGFKDFFRWRMDTIQLFGSKPFATVLTDGRTMVDGGVYFDAMRDHEFVVSPWGLGWDCMRTWESLYVGSIPICRRHPSLNHFQDMPIAWVNDYSDVTPEWMDAVPDLFREKTTERLYMSYWKDRVLRAYNLS